MTGIESGKSWSRIGQQVAPTGSAASGVWTLNEFSENVGAGAWPQLLGKALEYVSTFTVASTNSIYLEITGLPTKYRDVLIVADNMRLNTSGSAPYALLKHATSSNNPVASSGMGMWGKSAERNQFVKQGLMTSGNMDLMKGQSGVTDIAGGTSLACWGSWLLCDSSSTTRQKILRAYTDSTLYISPLWTGSPAGGAIANVIIGYQFNEAVATLRLDAKGAAGGATANYYWQAGSQFHIYGTGNKY